MQPVCIICCRVATVIDDLIDRVMADDRLNANPRVDEAHHRVSPAGFKYYVTEMLCGAEFVESKWVGRELRMATTSCSRSPTTARAAS